MILEPRPGFDSGQTLQILRIVIERIPHQQSLRAPVSPMNEAYSTCASVQWIRVYSHKFYTKSLPDVKLEATSISAGRYCIMSIRTPLVIPAPKGRELLVKTLQSYQL